MSDLINRQDAIEAVRKVWCDNDDREDFKQRYYEMGNNDAVEDAIGYIDALPSADAVEVVRCKDCMHWFPHTQCGYDEDNDEYHDYCGLLVPDDDYYAYTRKPDDYCSYGECREEEEER